MTVKNRLTGRGIIYGSLSVMVGIFTVVMNHFTDIYWAMIVGGLGGGIISLILGIDVYMYEEEKKE